MQPAINNTITDEQLNQPLIAAEQKQQLSSTQKLIDKVNGQGKFQFLSFLIFSFMWFVTSWLLVGETFFFDDAYECHNGQTFEECSRTVCETESKFRPQLISSHSDSIVFAFDDYLICDFEYVVTILQSMLFFGSLLGFFIIPYAADNFGRKIAIRISWIVCTLGVIIICLADSPNMIGIGYFFAGLGSNPAITLCFSFINESGIGKTRQLYGVGIQLFLAIGQSTIGLIFISQLHWYQVGYILLALCLVINVLLLYLLQTPKFLLKKSKKLALQCLNTIAQRNGREKLTEKEVQNIDVGKEDSEDNGSSIKDLFKYKSLRWKSIASGLVFTAIQVIYYSTSLNLDSVGDNKLLNQQIIGISQGISYVAAQFVVSRVYRKKLTFIGMLTSSGMCIVLAILTTLQTEQNHNSMVIAEIIVLLVNRFVLCASWAVFYVYIGELFPTRVRSLGFGWASALGTIGSAGSPYFRLFSDTIGFNPWIIPGIIGFVGTVSICCLPETFGLPLQDQIQEKNLETDLGEQDTWSDPDSPRFQDNAIPKNLFTAVKRKGSQEQDGSNCIEAEGEIQYRVINE